MTKKSEYKFLRRGEIQQELRQWHTDLHAARGHGQRAMLRRCTVPREILLLSSFYGFRSQLSSYLSDITLKDDVNRSLAMATIVGLFSHIKNDNASHSFASQLYGVSHEKSPPLVSELRFSQLQKSRDWDEFYRRLRRIIPLLGNQVNLISLADNILHWGYDLENDNDVVHSKPANRLLVCWAKDYFKAKAEAEGNR